MSSYAGLRLADGSAPRVAQNVGHGPSGRRGVVVAARAEHPGHVMVLFLHRSNSLPCHPAALRPLP